MPHWLLSIERRVPPDRSELYNRLWQRLLRQAQAAGLHAWRFRSAGREDQFLEFLESADAPSLDDPAVMATLKRMDQDISAAVGRRWEEVTSEE
ncbi:MAG: hypothetical protein P8Z36_01400 [Gemmatimonadota bacterium]|jgi:hypothetical protein